jgi:hydroxyacylglutathione hydrolase
MSIKVVAIPALKDNYIWAIINEANKNIVIVDPGDAAPVNSYLISQQYQLTAILITHKHWDHTAGIDDLYAKYSVPVYGPTCEAPSGISHQLLDNDKLFLTHVDLTFTVLHIPGHTLEHIAYYTNNCLFCGDTLFTGGCGRVFEGTYTQMYNSLQRLSLLPDETLIYCGHEYTLNNLQFAELVEPTNHHLLSRIKRVESLRADNQATVPAFLGEEKLTNPFLRCHLPNVKQAISRYSNQSHDDPIKVFCTMREWKNNLTK